MGEVDISSMDADGFLEALEDLLVEDRPHNVVRHLLKFGPPDLVDPEDPRVLRLARMAHSKWLDIPLHEDWRTLFRQSGK